MTTASTFQAPQVPTGTPLGRRVIVGLDGSPESVEAARQAALLTDPRGAMILVAAWQPVDTGRVADSRARAEHVVAAVRETLVDRRSVLRVVPGRAADVLRREAARQQATLLAIGMHGEGRLRGIVAGATATELLHRAPCPVLIARPAGLRFPLRIAVGIDGSPESAAAYTVASELARRFGADLDPVVAFGDDPVDRELVEAIAGYRYEAMPDDAVRALVVASTEVDLVIVGSRCLQGIKALGSVSERVAHEAHSSVLVVRLPHRGR